MVGPDQLLHKIGVMTVRADILESQLAQKNEQIAVLAGQLSEKDSSKEGQEEESESEPAECVGCGAVLTPEATHEEGCDLATPPEE